MCFSLLFVIGSLDMPSRRVLLRALETFGDIRKTLANVAVVLQQQSEVGSSRRTP